MKRQRSKRVVWLVSMFLFVLCVSAPILSNHEAIAASEKVRLVMGGASTTTWVYMFSAIMVDVWKRYIPNLDITLMATSGSTANYAPMERGELDLAVGSTHSDFWAMGGMHFAKTKHVNFYSLMPAAKAIQHYVTYADSPIKTLKDLEGKKIALGARASPTSLLSEEIFSVLGIKANYVYSTPGEAGDMLKDRRVDAMVYNVAAPYSVFMDVATDRPIRFLDMTPEERKKASDALPYVVNHTIPAKTYTFQNQDNQTVTAYSDVVVKPNLPDELVYTLTKVAWEHWDEVVKATAAAKSATARDIVNMYPPVHPGAAKYYKEIGIQLPDRLIAKKK